MQKGNTPSKERNALVMVQHKEYSFLCEEGTVESLLSNASFPPPPSPSRVQGSGEDVVLPPVPPLEDMHGEVHVKNPTKRIWSDFQKSDKDENKTVCPSPLKKRKLSKNPKQKHGKMETNVNKDNEEEEESPEDSQDE